MTDKTYQVRLLATITLPEGTTENTSGRGWVLPDGTLIKPFVVLEKNEEDNLTYDQGADLGVYVDEDCVLCWADINA